MMDKITTPEDHEKALKRVEELWECGVDGEEFLKLIDLIVKYECEFLEQ